MSELRIYKECLTCTFRELEEQTVYRSRTGLVDDIVCTEETVECCIHEPMCRWVVNEWPISSKVVGE